MIIRPHGKPCGFSVRADGVYAKIIHMTAMKKIQSADRHKIPLLMPKKYDRLVHISIMTLLLFGIVMVGSASMGLSVGNSRYLLFTVLKQVFFGTLGYIGMCFFANNFTLNQLKGNRFVSYVFIMIIALLVCLLFPPPVGTDTRAWLRMTIAGQEISIQPSEFAKLMAMAIVAAYCGDITKRFSSAREMLMRPVGFIVLMMFIITILQDDFGSAFVIFIITCVCLLIPNHPQMKKTQLTLKILFCLAVIASVYILSPAGESLIVNLSFLKDYQKNRFLSAVDPFRDPYNTGFQLINGLVSFASGGWLGRGFGASIRKYMQFPAANTDYILAILVEELGIAGFMLLMALYCVIIFQLQRYAQKIHSEKAKIILVGVSIYLLVHMLLNIGGVTGLLPLTGVPLLMISSGGSSVMSFMVGIGLCQAVISAFNRGEIQ